MEKLVARIFYPFTGASTLVVKDNELLVVRKNDFYMLPGGTPEPGEKLEETAARETGEETGFEVEIEEYLGSIRQEGRGSVALFKAEIVGGEKSGSTEGEPEFLPIDRITQENWRFDRDMKPVIDTIESEFNT